MKKTKLEKYTPEQEKMEWQLKFMAEYITNKSVIFFAEYPDMLIRGKRKENV